MTEQPTDHAADPEPADRPTPKDPLRTSRVSRLWVALIGLVVVLLLLVVFVAQNTQHVQVSFLGWKGHPPLAVALLIAVVAGLAIAVSAGTLRILQLHRRVRHTP
jgi:uncharacterized integral membrane protein